MKHHSWTSTGASNPQMYPDSSEFAWRSFFNFSTGGFSSSRYVYQIFVHAKYARMSDSIRAAIHPAAGGGKYYPNTSMSAESSDWNPEITSVATNWSQAMVRAALTNGIYINCTNGTVNIKYMPILAVDSYQGKITPTGSTFTSGSIARYTKYRLEWTTDAEDEFERSNSTCQIVITDQNGGNVKTVTLANGATSYDLDTTQWSGGTGLRWKVLVGAYASGTVTESPTYTLSLVDPTAKVDDLRPTSKTYFGFESVFSWTFTGSIASGSSSGALQQGSAVLQYRTDNMPEPAQFASVNNGTTHVNVNCGVLPVGSYQWRVVATSTVGTKHTSGWVQCTNVEVPISVKGVTPAEGAHAPRAIINRFSWAFSVDSDDAPGDVVQRSAVLHFKTDNEVTWHKMSVNGSQQYCDVPAFTFAEGAETLDWYVEAVANTGSTATSDTITVSTKDALSTPVAISPAGEYLDDAIQGIKFTWAHANITGTAQFGWEISYSSDSGASYNVFASADDDASSYQAKAGVFPSGVIYWRVRTKNTDGVFGEYSGAAIFAIRRAPVAPVISYYDNKPLAMMRWQAMEQDGYEIAVDGISLGIRYGTGKVWQSDEVLGDGKHTLQVRIYNAYGDVSPWSTCEINVKNLSGTPTKLYAESRWGEVVLRWIGDSGYILRDGVLIARAEGGTYTDRASANAYLYIVRVFDEDGYYTDSAPVMAAPSVPYAAIGPLHGDWWLALKYATSYQNYSKTISVGGSLQQYWSKEKPVWHNAGNQVVTHTISHAIKNYDELDILRSLAGQEVVYKDHNGHLAIGIFQELQENRDFGCIPVSFSITETQQEDITYDTV